MLADAPSIAQAIKEFKEFVREALLVGYNVNFDINFLYDNLLSTEKEIFDEEHPLFGKVCVFTGILDKMQRKEAMQIVADLGGSPGDGVTKKTNYLILEE